MQCGFSDHFRSLTQACINYFHTSIAQCACDHFGTPIMSVQSGFGNKYTDLFVCHFSSADEFLFHYTMMVDMKNEPAICTLNRNDTEISITYGAPSRS